MDARHPSDEMLHSYGLGQLDDGPAGAIDGHLETCPDCRRRAATLSSASYLDWRRGVPKGAGPSRTGAGPGERGETASFVPAGDSPSPGPIDFPDYEIRKELGRGGMGVVYLAHNRLMGRDEVLKVMGHHLMRHPGSFERFLREIRAVARLRHPNIVTAYSATRVGAGIVLAMEYVEGLDLSKMVRAKGPLPVAHACNFIHQAALGLQHAHEEGLVHRDIKPGNLMLSRKGDRATIKVLDFGLAKATREERVDASLTAQGQALGTPDFIAPEQIKDSKSADIRADIYGLGGTLYYLLTGRPPFPSESLYDLFQAHLARDADPLDLVRPDVPPGLAALVARMMAKDPARRPQTPGEVAEALAPYFKKAGAADARPKADVPPAGVAFDETRPEADAPRRDVGARTAAESPAAGSRWEDLIDFREEEEASDEAPAGDPGRRPLWKTWPALVAASLLGLVAPGVVIFLATRPREGGEVPAIARAEGAVKEIPARSSKPGKEAGRRPPRSAPARTIDPEPAPAPAAATPTPAATVAVDKPPAASTATVPATVPISSATVDALRSETRSVYVDDFDDHESGWARSGSMKGYSAGAYFVASDGPWVIWGSPRRVRTDGTLEVVGRLKSEGPIVRGSWAVIVTRMIGEARRGFMVTINGKGELFLMPNPQSREPIDADPTLGPIVHPAIRPGGQPNTVLIAMKKQSLEVFVNSARVCGPLAFTYDLTPSTFSLGAFDGPGDFRAEFDRVEVREFSDGKPRPTPTPDDSLRTATRQVYVDDFSDPATGWPLKDNTGYSAGVYFVQPGKSWSGWNSPRRIRAEGTLEVVGRLQSAEPITRGAWGVVVSRPFAAGFRGVMVKINARGELFVLPSPFDDAKPFSEVDLTLGPIVHPAIKPGGQPNTLLLVVKKRSLEILVNSARVCEPIDFDYDLAPAHLTLGAFDGPGNFRAEFEEVKLREFTDGRPKPAPTVFSSIKTATRPVYFDDFSNPASGWGKGDNSGYGGGIYFVKPNWIKKVPSSLRTDSTLEVIGRVKTAGGSLRGSWVVAINRELGTGRRGIYVKINGKGELFLRPLPWDDARQFEEVDPTIGPIVHPAIRPANQPNTLVLVIRKRSLEIFVNAVRVCDPVPYDFDLVPSFIEIGAWDGPGDFRAEFDSVVIREFGRPRN